jgi:hypothetical protein
MQITTDAMRRLAFFCNDRHRLNRESDGRRRRQLGQILTEAAVTIFLRVIRLLYSHCNVAVLDIHIRM